MKIDLIVRGICACGPGSRASSENIRVRSIVGRFLEHTRVYYFQQRRTRSVYLSSADWMGRNFFSRVEACFPIHDPVIVRRILREVQLYLSDNCQAWLLQPDGSYRPAAASGGRRRSAQETLLRELADTALPAG